MYGICSYIKENYNLSDYIFSGASAGAWNSLMMTCKKDITQFKYEIIEDSLNNSKDIFNAELILKQKLLHYYKTEDFDLDRLFIGVTILDGCKLKLTIYNDFKSLEDAIDCCIASSHIPLITGGIINKYNNYLTFDGGFFKNPYVDVIDKKIHISPSMWNIKKNKILKNICEITTLFSKDLFNFNKLFDDGYNDAKNNKEYFDSIFNK